MKIIDFEHHFFTPAYIDYIRQRTQPPREIIDEDGPSMWYSDTMCSPRSFKIEDKLADLGERRLKEMDADGVDMAILSLSPPGVQHFEAAEGTAWARKINDDLSKVVKRYPDRFIGLACIAPQSPAEAADEIERAVTELGLKGVVIHSHARNEYLDDKKYRGIFARAERLDAPIYIHPDVPSTLILPGYADYGFELAGPVLGFAADVALHAMRLICSGLFDEHPKLQIVLGHLGEGLPFWMDRIDLPSVKPWKRSKLRIERRPSDYLKTNFTITTSGMFFLPSFMCAYLALGADRMAFAVDYPYEGFKEPVDFMKKAPISDTDKEKILYLTAAKLFKL